MAKPQQQQQQQVSSSTTTAAAATARNSGSSPGAAAAAPAAAGGGRRRARRRDRKGQGRRGPRGRRFARRRPATRRAAGPASRLPKTWSPERSRKRSTRSSVRGRGRQGGRLARSSSSSLGGGDDNDPVKKIGGGNVLSGWISILYALIFCYTAGANLWTGPSNVRGNPGDTLVCKAAQIVMLPLYKPTALSMWSAFMPLVQLAYWTNVRRRIKKREDEIRGETVGRPERHRAPPANSRSSSTR